MIYLKLFFVFAKIGLFGFGGGMAMLPVIYQNAKDFGFMTSGEFEDLVAISQVTPGPISVNAATYVGYNTAGYLGALVATFGVAFPCFVLVTITYYFVTKFRESHAIQGAFYGIRPVTAGLIAAAFLFVARGVFKGLAPIPIIIFGVTVALMYFKKLSPITIIILAGIAGALLCR